MDRSRPSLKTDATSARHLEDLRAQAQHAQQRYDLYKARAYGQRPISETRMRELQRGAEQTRARLRAAEAERPHAGNPPPAGDGPPT